MRAPDSIRNLVSGWRGGSGDGLPRSPLTTDGGTRDQVPIAVLVSRESGSKSSRECLAIISRLKEDASGEHILTLSWVMRGNVIYSETEETPGDSEETRFDLLIPIEHLPSTLRNTSQSLLTTGISGVPCDVCGEGIKKGDPYRTDIVPPHGLLLLCLPCAAGNLKFQA